MIDLNKVLDNKLHNAIFICPVCKTGFNLKKDRAKVVFMATQVPVAQGVTIGSIPTTICKECFKKLDLMEEDIELATQPLDNHVSQAKLDEILKKK